MSACRRKPPARPGNQALTPAVETRVERHLATLRASEDMKAAQRRELRRYRLEESEGKAPWRARHNPLGGPEPAVGPVEQTTENRPGSNKIIGSARRCLDTLALLHKRGTITDAEEEAGRRFQEDFHAARLDQLRAAALLRSPGGAVVGPEGSIQAGRAVARALETLGGRASPLGLVVWEVLGCGRAVTEVTSARRLRNGWALNKHAVKSLLIAGLVVLSMTYGLARGK